MLTKQNFIWFSISSLVADLQIKPRNSVRSDSNWLGKHPNFLIYFPKLIIQIIVVFPRNCMSISDSSCRVGTVCVTLGVAVLLPQPRVPSFFCYPLPLVETNEPVPSCPFVPFYTMITSKNCTLVHRDASWN